MNIDREAIREYFKNMSREALLEEIALRESEFVPSALMLLKAEVNSRGITKDEIEQFKKKNDVAVSPRMDFKGRGDGGPLIPLATFDDGIFAEQARIILEDHGIDAFIKRTDRSLWKNTPHQPGEISLYVFENSAVEAGRLLEDFLPASDDRAQAAIEEDQA